MTERTMAVILTDGVPVAYTLTTARGGERVDYGWQTVNDGTALLKIGSGKISRNKRCLQYVDTLPRAYVNYGGGAPV